MPTLTPVSSPADIKSLPHVFVLFGASTCTPCGIVKKQLEKLDVELEIRVAVCDKDRATDAWADSLDIKSIPALIEFRDGAPTGRQLVGSFPPARIKSWLVGG